MDSFKTDDIVPWPQENGHYWFYGYRFGKYFGSGENAIKKEKELMLCNVTQTPNGMMIIANGGFMWRSEIEEQQFIKATLPELP